MVVAGMNPRRGWRVVVMGGDLKWPRRVRNITRRPVQWQAGQRRHEKRIGRSSSGILTAAQPREGQHDAHGQHDPMR